MSIYIAKKFQAQKIFNVKFVLLEHRGSGKLTYSLNASKWCGLVTRVSFKVCTLRPSL